MDATEALITTFRKGLTDEEKRTLRRRAKKAKKILCGKDAGYYTKDGYG